MAWISLVSAIWLGVSGLIEPGPMLPPDAYSWIVLVALAFVAQALGWWSISTALSRLEGSHSGLILLLQPVADHHLGRTVFCRVPDGDADCRGGDHADGNLYRLGPTVAVFDNRNTLCSFL